MEKSMCKVLIGSPIRQKPSILEAWLDSFDEWEQGCHELSFCFVDDNEDTKSRDVLLKFAERKDGVQIKRSTDLLHDANGEYGLSEVTHFWSAKAIKKVALFKDWIIEYALDNGFDYLFLIDSDVVLHPKAFLHLLARDLDIVVNVFWTQYKNGPLEPQVMRAGIKSSFASGSYACDPDWRVQLKIPGLYEVECSGACTLIKRGALLAGCRFSPVANIEFNSEDKDFCVRAGALGYKIFVDSVFPAYHIYRESYLDRLEEFKKNGFSYDMCQSDTNAVCSCQKDGLIQKGRHFIHALWKRLKMRSIQKSRNTSNDKLVCAMIVRNEAHRYLPQVFRALDGLVDTYVIVDDASNDDTVNEIKGLLPKANYKITQNTKPMFAKEWKLRTKLWKEVSKQKPGWVLCLDADEVLEETACAAIRTLIKEKQCDLFAFRLFDMWNETQYRNDELWHAHKKFWPYLCRFIPKIGRKWQKTNQHCGRFPVNSRLLQQTNVDIRVKHMGWAKEADRMRKFYRYKELDPKGEYGNAAQYDSILDQDVSLVDF